MLKLEQLEQTLATATANGKAGSAGTAGSLLDSIGASGLSWRPLLTDVRGFGLVPLPATLPRGGTHGGAGGGLQLPAHGVGAGAQRSRSHSTSPEQTLDSSGGTFEPYNVVIDVVRESLGPPSAAAATATTTTPQQQQQQQQLQHAASNSSAPTSNSVANATVNVTPPMQLPPAASSAVSVANPQTNAKTNSPSKHVSLASTSTTTAPSANTGSNYSVPETRSSAPVKPSHPPHSNTVSGVQSQRQTPANTQPLLTHSMASQQQQQPKLQAQSLTNVADAALRPHTNAPIAQHQISTTAQETQRQSALSSKGPPPPVPANKPTGPAALHLRPAASQPAANASSSSVSSSTPPVSNPKGNAVVQPTTARAQKADGPTPKPSVVPASGGGGGGQRTSQTGGGGVASTSSMSPTHAPAVNRAEYVAGRRCIALFDCEADNVDELSFRAGQIIRVLHSDTAEEDWLVRYAPVRSGFWLFACLQFLYFAFV